MSLTADEFRRLYETQLPLLTRQLRRQYRAQADEVEDVVQDSFDKLWRHFGTSTDTTPESQSAPRDLGGWLFRTANNAMIDRTRMQKRRPTTDIDALEATGTPAERTRLAEASANDATSGEVVLDPDDAPADPIDAALDVMHVVLPLLKERDRVLLTLKYIDGLSYDDIAARLDLSRGAIGTTLLRARRAAQALFEQEIARRRPERAATRRHIS